MKENNRKKVNRILEDVLELETSEREKFLNEISIEDDIRREVEMLLAFEEEAENALNFSAVEFSKSFFEAEEKSPLLGQKVGAFRIVREIGTGGMGAVYLAERADGKFVQKVALKLLKREMNTAALRRRFQHEREILASLEHPNIARLVDAGATEDKIPFLAMEYVEGLPIDVYCNKNNLDLNERLDLFRKVCAAVDFAHRSLVVHRDLKPSNILVTEDGAPKLLDFGISKFLSEDLRQSGTATVTKMGVMTPPYASPEQLQKKSVTTATDIYSLGVILYELLSGHRPFEEKEDDLKEIYSAVIEKEPPPPSRISDFGFRISDFSHTGEIEKHDNTKNATAKFSDKLTNRSQIETNPQSPILNPKSLRGDLDNIILKALKKEPERRYSSAENFAADIERYQKGLPVTARPDTFSYRAGKFIKRNSLTVAAAALIMLAVLGGVAATLWQAEQARKEAAKAKKINEFLQDVLNFSNPHWLSSNPEKNRNATISEAVDAAVIKLETDLKDEPEIQAEIHFTLGKTYVGQGRNQEAERQLRSALEKFSKVYGTESPQVMKTKVILGDSLFLQGDYQQAEKEYLDSINYFRQNDAEDENPKKWLAIASNNLGLIRQNQGKFSEAEQLFSESLELARSFEGADRWVKPIALANLGGLNISLGNLEKSLNHLTEAEKEMKIYSETPRLEDAGVQKLIGRVYKMSGDFAEAEKRLLESHRIFVANVGENHQFTAQPLSELADVYFMQGKFSEAEKTIDEALSIQQKILSENHWEVLFAKAVLGKTMTKTGRIEDGGRLLTEVLKAQEKISKNPNYIVAETKFALAENLIAQKKYAEAINLLKANYSELSSITASEHPTLLKSKNLLDNLETGVSGL